MMIATTVRIALTIALVVAVAPPGALAQQPTSAAAQPPATESVPIEKARYACPMETHPDQENPAHRGPFFSTEPGRCAWCGMKLKPVEKLGWFAARKAAAGARVAYTCPEHQHVFSTKPGTCPRCAHKLEPFKLMYTCPDPKHADVVSTRPGNCPKDGRLLVPFRGIWLAPEMAEDNNPPHPELARGAAYRCPMHPLVHSDKPGACTICGQPLVAAAFPASAPHPSGETGKAGKAEFVCPMHPEQARAAAPGTCPICGMQLVNSIDLTNPATAPAAISAQVDYLMEHYLALQQRLASDREDDVTLHALGLVGAASKIDKLLGGVQDAHSAELRAAARKLRTAALMLTGKDIDEDRVSFVQVSDAMRRVVEHARPSRKKYPAIYVFHCPMTKGDWLQTNKELANPFYGFKMLKCGKLTETK